MFSTRVFVVSALALLATAVPEPYYYRPEPVTTTITVTETPQPVNQCITGPVQCCSSLVSSDSVAASTILGLLGVTLQGVQTTVGLTCSPITILGSAETSCSAQTVCCANNNFNGVANIGCSPINIA